jgi:hypothetical protein
MAAAVKTSRVQRATKTKRQGGGLVLGEHRGPWSREQRRVGGRGSCMLYIHCRAPGAALRSRAVAASAARQLSSSSSSRSSLVGRGRCSHAARCYGIRQIRTARVWFRVSVSGFRPPIQLKPKPKRNTNKPATPTQPQPHSAANRRPRTYHVAH